jgi:UDP-N-acetylglucosamine acyltransferase
VIHPTAVIDPAAELAADVRIGAYVCIEGPVRIGAGCEILAQSVLTGRVTLGQGNRIGHGAVIGGWPQDLKFDPETASGVVIGDGNVIREHCTIHRGTAPGTDTVLGNGCLLMAGAHLGHNVRAGDGAIIANNVLLGGYVEVGERVFIGGGSVFHQFVRVGEGAMVQGLSAFSKDVPPFTLAAERNLVFGLNVVGLRRAGWSPAERAEIKAAFKLLYANGMNVTQALAAARAQTWGRQATYFFEFAAAAKRRGLCGFGRAPAAAEGG